MESRAKSSYFSKKITFLNVMLTFSIVILHAKTPERWGLPLDMSHPFIYWMQSLGQIGVPTFFFISGLLFYRMCRFEDIERKLLSRVHSLAIPYFIWNFMFVGIFFIFSRISAIHKLMNMGDVFRTSNEVVYAILNARYTDLWFVKDLIIFCMLSAPIFLLLRNKAVSYITLLVSIGIVLTVKYGYEHPLNWFPVFFMGAIMGTYYTFTTEGAYLSVCNVMKNKSMRYVLVLALFFLFTALYVASTYSVHEKAIFLFRLCSPIMIWLLVDLLFEGFITHHFEVRPWMRYMFFIYCTHHFILNVLQKIVVLKFLPTPLVLNTVFVITPVLTVLIAIAMARVLSRYKFYVLLSGGR